MATDRLPAAFGERWSAAQDRWNRLRGLFPMTADLLDPTVRRPIAGCGLTNSTEIEVKNEVDTPITWNTEEWDDGGCHSLEANTSRLVVPTGQDGIWAYDFSFWWAAVSGAGRRNAYVRVNGSTSKRICVIDPSQSPAVALNLKGTKKFVGGDYIELMVWQNSGGAEKIRKDNYGTSFETCRASFERLR